VSSAVFVLAVAVFFSSISAQADLPEWISGKAILDHHARIGATEGRSRTLQSGLTLYTRADPKFTSNLDGRFELRGSLFRHSVEKGEVWTLRGDAKNANLAFHASGWHLRVGQILTPWGRSDGVNPTDYLTARDYTFLSSHDEVRRLGAPGAVVSYVPAEGNSPFEFTVAWNARYPQSKMLIPATAVPAGLSVQTEPETPSLLADHQEVAVKAAYLAPNWDASLSAFDGRSHFGQFVWNGSRVTLEYLPVRALGGDFSVTFDDFVLRGESAYYFYDLGSSGLHGLSLTEPNHWDTVLGVERPFGMRFRVLVQLLYRLHPGLTDSNAYVGANPIETVIVREIARANALIQNYQRKSRLGATFLFSYDSENGDWHGELGGIGNFVGGGDYVLRPKVSRKIAESLRVLAGLEIYGGRPDLPLGSLRNYRSLFVEGMYSF
jgi:hypothetical protein